MNPLNRSVYCFHIYIGGISFVSWGHHPALTTNRCRIGGLWKINKKCGDPPNIRPSAPPNKYLTAHISRGVLFLMYIFTFSILYMFVTHTKMTTLYNGAIRRIRFRAVRSVRWPCRSSDWLPHCTRDAVLVYLVLAHHRVLRVVQKSSGHQRHLFVTAVCGDYFPFGYVPEIVYIGFHTMVF